MSQASADRTAPAALPQATPTDPALSIVIPLLNEAASIGPLYEALAGELAQLGRSYEIIFVDDGSTDGTREKLREFAARDARVRAIFFRRNFGQTAALMAGFDAARGEVLVAMDGDGQNDPTDLAALLAKLDEGYDVVSGWRHDRQDSGRRRVSSRLANRLISWVSGVRLKDYGCTLKAYRRDAMRDVRIYGEMHRFIPIFASWQGARVAELRVQHHPRRHGTSHYGFERTLKVLLDLIVILFMDRYSIKPIYVFGTFGFANVLGSLLAGLYALYLKFAEGVSFIMTPLPLLVALFFIVGVMSVLMGLLAEMIMRTYFESQNKTSYAIKETLNF